MPDPLKELEGATPTTVKEHLLIRSLAHRAGGVAEAAQA
jgi:hypothetical protein